MMKRGVNWRWLIVCWSFLLGTANYAHAAIVSMDLYVSFPIYQNDGVTFLPDGSIVEIVSSPFTEPAGHVQVGSCYIWGSTQSNEVILATTTIGTGVLPGSGTFFLTILFDNAIHSNLYIRFYNTNGPPNTNPATIVWGQSTMMVGVGGTTLGVANVDFNQDNNLLTDQTNCFVVIPEPSTANLFVLMAGMMWAMRAHMRRARANAEQAG
ncbi:MAG TPA: hypothetical protein PKE26_00370 [Kiritimatiellia bacterium]|nr:hypothetical protein [Kiritimatiellia bacterium]HMO97549.1 hypothetical protein [Kiritimatiellia bacterium]HMP97013.1 hypothetical protein [Kiritimatiellia bacterium]